MLVTLSAVALTLDLVDGWVARRSNTASNMGARFDGGVDAFLILVLSVYVAPSTGAWVLAIGAAHYAFLVAGWLLPWMREPLPPRYWRKVVAAVRSRSAVAAADVLPCAPDPSCARSSGALALLCESFGRDVWWLWAHRHAAAGHCCGGRNARTFACGRCRGAHGRRGSVRLGRSGRSGPSESSHAECVREGPTRGHRRHCAGPRAARHGSTRPGLGSSGRSSAYW